MQHVQKPINRGRLRKILGKEYFIFKRNLRFWFGADNWATNRNKTALPFTVFQHHSVLLRQLKDVDMWLQENKVENLKLAIAKIDGVIIRPGETFSIWKLVGRTAKWRGYKIGMTLENGRVSTGVGGGLCQLGNLLYWTALHSPLTVIERYRHGFDVFPDVHRTIPFGCGATLSYNYIDLLLKNNTANTFQIKLWLDDKNLNVLLLSDRESFNEYKVTELNHKICHQWWGGYTRHNRIERTVHNTQTNQKHQEYITENHAIMMYEPLLEK